ncbi:hypothetical protein PT974_11387 [Cladobotryum mycophilum]|uniref:Integral membrane protein n=1 Tax=Cladobotryum mycophilum TaxID=491253 RepID=A0ABR0S521_9HYPO
MAGPNTRRNAAIAAALCYLIAITFLILTIIGNTYINPTLNDIYFFKLDVSQVIPISVENSYLLNSVARSLGLHDFYQVGLWNFCEGYNDEGVTHCSEPKQFYWFNPVEVLVSELLAGAKIALPSEVTTILRLLQAGQQVMYAFFLAGTVINAIILLCTFLVLKRRWFSAILAFLGSISGLLLTVAAVIATVISVAAKIALTAQDQLNIKVDIGTKMFAFMWIGALMSDLGFLLQAAMGCCCLPNRRNDGDAQVETTEATPSEATTQDKPSRFSIASFARRRNVVS